MSDLVGNLEDRFSHDAAHMVSAVTVSKSIWSTFYLPPSLIKDASYIDYGPCKSSIINPRIIADNLHSHTRVARNGIYGY